jgi:hypothetical protein
MKCKQCRYYTIGELMGQCNRFPRPVNKSPSHWCGEFVLKEVTLEVVPDNVPVVVIGELVEIKKRGRKPNVNKGTE